MESNKNGKTSDKRIDAGPSAARSKKGGIFTRLKAMLMLPDDVDDDFEGSET